MIYTYDRIKRVILFCDSGKFIMDVVPIQLIGAIFCVLIGH